MDIFNLVGKIAIDTNESNKAIDETTKKAKDGEKQQTSAFNKIGGAATTLAKGVVGVGAALGGAFIAATEGTREYRVSMGKLETAFTTSGHSAATAQKTYSTLNSVLGDSDVAVEASAHLAKLVDNEKDMETWTNICTGAFATFGDSLPIESITESANEVAKSGQLTGGLVDALVWAGVGEEEFQAKLDACNTEQERQSLITETLNGLYSESAEKYKEINADVIAAEAAQGRLSAAMAGVGAILEPLMTSAKNGLAGLMEKLLPFAEYLAGQIPIAIDFLKAKFEVVLPYLQLAWQGAWTVLQTVWNTVGKPIFELIKWAAAQLLAFWQQNWPAISQVTQEAFQIIKDLWENVLKPVLAILSKYINTYVVPVWKTAFTAVKNVVQTAFNGVIDLWNNSLKPILNGIISFVSGVLTGNWSKAWDGIKSIVSGVFGGIQTVISNKIELIKSIFSGGLSILQSVASSIFESVRSVIAEKLEKAREKVNSVIEKIKSYFNITLKFKGLKMPTIKLTLEKGTGLIAKAAEVLGLDGVPKFSVKWNAAGGILTKPTIFGMDGSTLYGGGEAGAEAVIPIETLKAYMHEVIASRDNDIVQSLEIQFSRLLDYLSSNLPTGYSLTLETGVLAGELAPEINNKLADIYRHNKRGNTR